MKRSLVALIASVVMGIAGCGGKGGGAPGGSGGATVDASDPQRFTASVARIKEGMDDAKKTQFDADLMLFSPAALAAVGGEAAATGFKAIDGLTADEVHAKAEEARQAAKTKPGRRSSTKAK